MKADTALSLDSSEAGTFCEEDSSEEDLSKEDSGDSSVLNPEAPVPEAPVLHWMVRRRSLLSFLALILYIVIGIVISSKWLSHIDAEIYWIVQIVTTVGYGDFSVGEEEHLFVTIYVLVGIIIAASSLNVVLTGIHERAIKASRDQLLLYQAKIMGVTEKQVKKTHGHWFRASLAFLSFLLFIVGGAAFYALYEPCSCSYGHTKIEGCDETNYENCAATGGQIKTWQKSIYMSVVTLTTVGFGDLSPKTHGGRIFGSVWMLFGVLVTGFFVTTLSEAIQREEQNHSARVHKAHISKDIFKRLDTTKMITISRDGFRLYVLLMENKIDQKSLNLIDAIFNEMDINSDGTLSIEEVQMAFKDAHGTLLH